MKRAMEGGSEEGKKRGRKGREEGMEGRKMKGMEGERD